MWHLNISFERKRFYFLIGLTGAALPGAGNASCFLGGPLDEDAIDGTGGAEEVDLGVAGSGSVTPDGGSFEE